MAPDDEDPKVKNLIDSGSLSETIDAVTKRELERWFGLPSFEQLAEQPPPPPTDPEMAAVQERRQRALAAVDPDFLQSIAVRNEGRARDVFHGDVTLHVDEGTAFFDYAMADRAASIAEPREVELPEALLDDLKECTPQALLRDLHRPELDFEKMFEVVDVAAEQRLDIVAEVASAMATRWTLPGLDASPLVESKAVLEELRAERRRPWTEYLPKLTNRRVQE